MKKLILLIFFCLNFNSYSFALIKVDITRGNLDPLPIAVSPLHVDDSSEKLNEMDVKKLGIKVSEIIERNFNLLNLNSIKSSN